MSMVPAACIGLGLLTLWQAATAPDASHTALAARSVVRVVASAMARAHISPAVLGWSVGCAGVVFIAVESTVRIPAISTTAALAAGSVLLLVRQTRHRNLRRHRREAWPDAVDHVASAVRAGLTVPEALRQLADHGPMVLRPDFASFARHEAAYGRFEDSLSLLQERLRDPAADRLVECLRLARTVGGGDVGRLLRTLSMFLREDLATRSELAARTSWTINAGRLALAAPWAALVLAGLRGPGLDAYRTGEGTLVIVGGTGISVLAYLLMRRIGRLPDEVRVVR